MGPLNLHMQIEEIEIGITPLKSRISQLLCDRDSRLSRFFPKGHEPESYLQKRSFDPAKRASLQQVLWSQYEKNGITLGAQDPVRKQIESLINENTYTVTAGQQIHAYLGPLFVHHKIRSAIEFCSRHQKNEMHLVPIFWMASEDHDFEEIAKFKLFGEIYSWNHPDQRNIPVGRRTCEGLKELGDAILAKLENDAETAAYVKMMQKIYVESQTFAEASRKILHELFGDEGLVILDPDDAVLKETAIHILRQGWENPGDHLLESQDDYLGQLGLKPVISSRDTHLFLIHNGIRERLDKSGDHFILKESGTILSREQLNTLDPVHLSPNVALRPIYQETVLPNLVYISGGTEMIYWLQILSLFEYYQVPYPYVFLRKSALLLPIKVLKTLHELNLKAAHLFSTDVALKNELATQLQNSIASDLNTWNECKRLFHDFESIFRKSALFKPELLNELKALEKQWSNFDKSLKHQEENLFENESNYIKISKLKSKYSTNIQEREEPLFLYLKFLNALRNPKDNYIFTKNTTLSMVFCA